MVFVAHSPIRRQTVAKFRTRLAALRQAKELSRMDIVRMANLSYPTVTKWETKPLDSVEANTVDVLCRILECTQEELLYLEPDE